MRKADFSSEVLRLSLNRVGRSAASACKRGTLAFEPCRDHANCIWTADGSSRYGRAEMQTVFAIETAGQGLTEFTPDVARWLRGRSDGLLTLFVRHTSCSLLIQENADPEVRDDLHAYFHRLVPPTSDPSMSYLTHTYEGPDDMPGHIKAALLPVSLSIPVQGGQMRLGTWQGIYLFEHRNRPHDRQVAAHFFADR